MAIKLPKQWRHWCKLVGLRPEGKGKYNRSSNAWLSLRGLGRRWRINCYGELSVSLKEEYFDRWALSHVRSLPMPHTEAAFLELVAVLLFRSLEADEKRRLYLAE